MKLTNLFKRGKVQRPADTFSDFFRNASKEEQIKVFKEAARRANEDQRKLFNQAKSN